MTILVFLFKPLLFPLEGFLLNCRFIFMSRMNYGSLQITVMQTLCFHGKLCLVWRTPFLLGYLILVLWRPCPFIASELYILQLWVVDNGIAVGSNSWLKTCKYILSVGGSTDYPSLEPILHPFTVHFNIPDLQMCLFGFSSELVITFLWFLH